MATARYGRAEAMPPGVQAKGPHHNAVHVQARGPHHNGGATLGLDTPVQFLTGVGPARAQAFGALGVQTVGDLIEHFPFRYELTPKSVPIGALRLGEKATIIGAITGVRSGGPGRAVVAHVVDATGRIRVRWFNAPYMEQRLGRGQTVRVSGTVEMYRDEAQFVNPRLEFIDPDRDPFEHDMDAFEPVYPAGAGLTSRQIAALIRRALAQVGDALPEFLPDTVRRARQLPPRATAIQRYHRPTQADDVQIARRRLAYDEFLILQLAVQLRRQFRKQHASAAVISVTPEIDRRIRARLPFQLTPGQNQAVAAITSDLARTQPMNRLLQADVGAGKTAIAVYAALATVANRRQVAIMAPTEILAEQHRAKFGAYLEGSRVRVGYLVGGQSKTARQHTLRSVAAGEIDVLIGTHALLETGVRFAACGLVVVDEQHKFGVFQRSAILNKPAAQPAHYLVLTATPIPRTLALTLFGDLDVSVIPDGPPGRQPITTRVVQAEEIAPVWDFVRQRLAAGEQAYVVYPLVDESDRLPLQAATREYEHLKHAEFPEFGVDLLHGRMSTAEKTAVMNRFRTGASRVLVATTVIEVGVDVPAATIMVVQHAERYGLSQLHQLRGRIGRGARKSYCILVDHGSQISDFRSQIPELNRHARDQSEIARRKSETDSRRGLARLEIMARTADGFQIAEEDLRLRGPGEVVGARQHGLPTLKVADLLSDLELLDWARADAARIVEADGRLSQPRFAALRAQVIARHGETAALTG